MSNHNGSSKEIFDSLSITLSYDATLKRLLTKLISDKFIAVNGKSEGTKKITWFKKIFINQFEFAVNTYF